MSMLQPWQVLVREELGWVWANPACSVEMDLESSFYWGA